MNLQSSLRPAYRKAAALGILAALLFAVFALAVAPVVESASERRESAARLHALHARYQAAAAELPSLQREVAMLERRRSGQGGYLDGANETLAAAALQARIKAAVLDAGGKLHSIEVLAPEAEDGLRKIMVRSRAAVGMEGIRQMLHALNETAPVLFFDALDIQAADRGGSATADEAAHPLELDFTVAGYLGRQR